jgi:phosphoribosyl 1,2-cyclic phosphodiesterase
MAVRVIPLGSGSRGNATLVEFGETRLLVDAGFSARDLTRRLAASGVEPRSIRFILLSHEHWDHTRGVERFSNLNRIPVACNRATLDAMNLSRIHLAGWRALETGEVYDLGEVRVDPFPIPHDAADPVGFVLEGEGVRVGIATDLGHATTLVKQRLLGCNILLLESNHDEAMLRDGPYPWHLKQRVGGRLGHLSNREAGEVLQTVAGEECRAVILAHLSEKNNKVTLARVAASRALASAGRSRVEMRVTPQAAPAPPVVL